MWIAIFIGIAAVVAVAAVLFFRSQPRMQHYMFAHDVVPRAVLADPVACLPHLLLNGLSVATKNQLLVGWWDEAKQSAPLGAGIPLEQMKYRTEVLGHPNATAFVIEMPPVAKPREAIAIVVVADGPGLAAGKLRLTRYFTLEANKAGDASISEWVQKAPGKLGYREHVKHCGRDIGAFLESVQNIVHADGSMPAPTAERPTR
jgi:hypothetical protein